MRRKKSFKILVIVPTLIGGIFGVLNEGNISTVLGGAGQGFLWGFIVWRIWCAHINKKEHNALLDKQEKESRAFLDDLKARGIVLKISKVECKNGGKDGDAECNTVKDVLVRSWKETVDPCSACAELYVYDKDYGQIWSVNVLRNLRYHELCSFPSRNISEHNEEGDYDETKFVDFNWDEDSVTLRYKCAGHHGNSDRYFEKTFNAYKEVLSWREL